MTLPSLNLDMSTDANRGFSLLKRNGKPRWRAGQVGGGGGGGKGSLVTWR